MYLAMRVMFLKFLCAFKITLSLSRSPISQRRLDLDDSLDYDESPTHSEKPPDIAMSPEKVYFTQSVDQLTVPKIFPAVLQPLDAVTVVSPPSLKKYVAPLANPIANSIANSIINHMPIGNQINNQIANQMLNQMASQLVSQVGSQMVTQMPAQMVIIIHLLFVVFKSFL